jgi:DNA end-binding protein Ku
VARSIRSAILTFGLVTIPVRFYTATSSKSPQFHLVHASCGSRVRQQLYCPVHERVVERDELVRGYEVSRGRHVTFTPEELDALESERSSAIEIAEFVPLASIDPVYFETTYYLGADEGGARAYALLAVAMEDAAEAAIAQFVWRDKENLAAIRAHEGALVLHTLFFADEVRDAGEVKAPPARAGAAELRLARRLVDELRSDRFRPEKYEDVYRERIVRAAREKAKGKTVTVSAPAERPGKVVDLMEALRASLGKRRPASAARGRARAGRGAARGRSARRRRAA